MKYNEILSFRWYMLKEQAYGFPVLDLDLCIVLNGILARSVQD